MIIKLQIILLLFTVNLSANALKGKEQYLIHCAACHSINMSGSLGKDFNIVSYTRTKQEIQAYMKNPGKLFKSFGYSANAMPTLPLTKQEVNDISDYIDSLQPFKKWMKKKH